MEDFKHLPLVAIMAGSTTRRVDLPSTDNIALFTVLLPSLLRSLDCGFRYVYILGFDAGDSFYDSREGMFSVEKWFDREMTSVLKKNGIELTLKAVRVVNELKKPGPVFNTMARAAYELGSDFYYRLNDDSELRGRWPQAYVSTLMGLGRPYGVIGPSSYGSNDRILTHDFVHRTHMEIFEMNYYPPELPDWWMDDWISSIYGRNRTLLSRNIQVQHHYSRHGQRYKVNKKNEHHLAPATARGRQLIRNWMLKNNLEVEEFDKQLAEATTKRAIGSGYTLKIRYHDMNDSTPNAIEIAEKEKSFLEKSIMKPGSGRDKVGRRKRGKGKSRNKEGSRRGKGKKKATAAMFFKPNAS